MERIYLDYNATTPLDPRVLEAMAAAARDTFGNPSSLHWYGQKARAAIEQARAEVAGLIGATPAEVVFTSGGTEADNLALVGSALAATPDRRRLVLAAIEHHAVIHGARTLAELGWDVVSVRPGISGVIETDELRRHVDERTVVVALMLANNETGLIQPVAEAARLAHDRGALFLCDAVQGGGKLPIDVAALEADLLAVSAHKIYGPKGVGALYVKRGTRMKPLLRGGAQERNRRAGTENVPGVVGFGLAARLAAAELEADAARIAALRDTLEARLLAIPGAMLNGQGPRVANTLNVSFGGLEAESLLMALDLCGVAVSTGAACAAGTVEPSHVLRAMGLPADRVQSSLRFSLGRPTTLQEVERAAASVSEVVERQRRRQGIGNRFGR